MAHKHVDTPTFKNMIEENVYELIDVRTPEEFMAGHIKDAANIDYYHDDFQSDIAKLDKNKKYLLYCRSGNRSGMAMDMMKMMGFEEVYNLEEGIISWNEHEYEIVNS